MQKHPYGFAFLLSLNPRTPDTYVDKGDAALLLNRDLVRFSLVREGKRVRARILEVLERGTQTVYGQLLARPSPHIVTPTGDVLAVVGKVPCPSGNWVIARIKEYPSKRNEALVEIEEVFGEKPRPSDDPIIAVAVLGLPNEFPLSVKLEARRPPPDDDDSREDLTSLPFVTIDGEDAKDFDDAIHVKSQSGETAWVLSVAIADVSHYVRPGTALDEQARLRSTSVYFPGHCIPMLPEALSNDLCSLIPDQERLVLVAEMHFDRFGASRHARFFSAKIRSRARLTYTEVHKFFNHESVPRLEPIKDALNHARSLYKKMRERRTERGALDFDFPEIKFQINAAGVPESVAVAPRYESHQLIEEFMVAANSCVAERLKDYPALFRVHESPDPDKLGDLNELLKTLGISKRLTGFAHADIAPLLEIKNPLLHRAILRMQRQARYRFEPLGHFGLALPDYLHFTSPIRRYPDLHNHRLLKEVLRGLKARNAETEDNSTYDLGIETSDKERRAMEAERFVVKRKTCWYMMKHVGEEFDALVSDLNNNGIALTLPNGIEGYIPGEFEYDEKKMRIKIGGEILRWGSPIRVQLVRVDLELGRLEFHLL